ncbi:MAG TPA: hypothetical protein DCZ55_31825 [Cyanobacteria bacterium UBA11371]|nr:hypothetical protein [Cyanobacteria bacterium UBA11371]
MSQELFEVLRLADRLSPDEQLELISYLVQRLRKCDIKRKPRRSVMEFAGVAPNLLGGMDAQEYVNRIRRGEFPELEIEQQESEKQE